LSQTWTYVNNDFGNEILFAGQCEEQSGAVVDQTTGDILTTVGSDLLQLGCIDVIGQGFSTLELSGNWTD